MAARVDSDVPTDPLGNPPLGGRLPSRGLVLHHIQEVRKHLAAIEKWVKKQPPKKPPKKK